MLFHELGDNTIERFLRIYCISSASVGGVQHLGENGKRINTMNVRFTCACWIMRVHRALHTLEERGEDTGEVVDGKVGIMILRVVGVAGEEAVGGVEG